MRLILLFLPLSLFAVTKTLLSEAEGISKLYEIEMAKEKPPQNTPLTNQALELASTWFEAKLSEITIENYPNSLEWAAKTDLWRLLKEIGFEGACLEYPREKTSLRESAEMAQYWPAMSENAHRFGLSLIGDLIGNSSPINWDFEKALQNEGDYPSLYHLIAIDPIHWDLLPEVPFGSCVTNIPWLNLQELQRKGYIPEKSDPYTQESDWNTTVKVIGTDGKARRWIYLKDHKNRPIFSWLSSSFTAYRIASADALHLNKELHQSILRIDGNLPSIAQEMLSLWIRKMGAFSAIKPGKTLESLLTSPSDLIYDQITNGAMLHALMTQDARALQWIYALFLENQIDTKRLIHTLQPFDQHLCDWKQLLSSSKGEERAVTEALKQQLLKKDILNLFVSNPSPSSSWVDYCGRHIHLSEFESQEEMIQHIHLFLSFAYAMQPGIFSVSLANLLGAVSVEEKGLNPIQPSSNCLYSGLPLQLKLPQSFATGLKHILQARRESHIHSGELIQILPSQNPGTLLLLYALKPTETPYLLCLNFAQKQVKEIVELPELAKTSAIDLMLQRAEEKGFSSARFSFTLPPLTGRAFYFHKKYENDPMQ